MIEGAWLADELNEVRNMYLSNGLTKETVSQFQQIISNYYSVYGRDFPWRNSDNAYYVLLCEMMSQQTQIDRVVDKFQAFIKRFPTIADLAGASFSEVLGLWSGLGYNRRARYLHQTAGIIVRNHNGTIPSTFEDLIALAGIGPYTANAVLAFAHNKPVVVIETNIRTVFFWTFFERETTHNDDEIRPVIAQTLDDVSPANWYNGLMDAGAALKGMVGNLNVQSKTYTKQSAFEGSRRQKRGIILRILLDATAASLDTICDQCDVNAELGISILNDLIDEGMVVKKDEVYRLVD